MTALAEYYVPGLHIQDHSIQVPLDWKDSRPGKEVKGETISLFYRVVCAPEHVHDDLPLLVFLQGGPGGAGPRPLSPSSDGWIAEAVQHFRVILPDQRGTGRSSHIDANDIVQRGNGKQQAAYYKHFLADSIVRDFEHLRLMEFQGKRWVTLGQSYGGFLTLSYLSLFPEGVVASFTTGGIPHVPADAYEVYEHTFPRMETKTRQFYERYPQDVDRVAKVASIISEHNIELPNGDPFTVARLQTLGSRFGMKPSFEQVHWMLDTAFADGDGSAKSAMRLTSTFLENVAATTATSPLYWPLQECIYANGELERPLAWAAQRVRDTMPQFSVDARPLLFTGEAIFPWMFEQENALRPFRAAMDELMADTHFGVIYDAERLASNEVPLQAAVYVDDMYVDSSLQLDTLSRVGRSHYWATNEFEHDGVHGDCVFKHLYQEALNRGDLEELFAE